MRLCFILTCFLIISCSSDNLQKRSGGLISITYTSGSSIPFDVDGKFTGIYDANGTIVKQVSYDNQNRVITLEDFTAGITCNIIYHSNGLIDTFYGASLSYNMDFDSYKNLYRYDEELSDPNRAWYETRGHYFTNT